MDGAREHELLLFERLLSEVSATLILSSSSDVGERITRGLARLVELWEIDRASFIEYASSAAGWKRIIHATYAREGVPEVVQDPAPTTTLPWFLERMLAGDVVRISGPSEVPPEAHEERAFLERSKMRSVLSIPVRLGGVTRFYLALTSFTVERRWAEELVPRMRVLAEMFANALVRAETERALRKSEAQFRQLAESIQQVFWAFDVSLGRAIYVSPAFESIWGRSTEVALASRMGWMEAVVPEDQARVLEAVTGARGGSGFDQTYRIARPDGTLRWIRSRGFPISDEGGVLVRLVGIAEDITEVKGREEQLRQTQKMEAVGTLAAGVAHDFNNILSVILNYASLLVDDLAAGDPRRQDIEEIRKAGERAVQLTRQLLAFSRKQRIEPVTLDVAEVVRGLEKMLRRVLREDVELDLQLSNRRAVRSDVGQLEQVILNLVVNARDAMAHGGRLLIETKDVELRGPDAIHAGVEPGSFVRLAIEDTGCGMDAATRARIFEPFFTTKARGKGTGLGLSTVFGIVKQAEGGILVHSEPGQGARFELYLPSTAAVPPKRQATGEAAIEGRGAETILLTEDDPQVRSVIAAVLRRYGYRVIEAASGQAALEAAGVHAGEIDLLLTDVVMPGMSGTKLAQLVRELWPRIKVMCMSGYADDTVSGYGVLESGIVLLQKPIAPELLVRRVREVLGGATSG